MRWPAFHSLSLCCVQRKIGSNLESHNLDGMMKVHILTWQYRDMYKGSKTYIRLMLFANHLLISYYSLVTFFKASLTSVQIDELLQSIWKFLIPS